MGRRRRSTLEVPDVVEGLCLGSEYFQLQLADVPWEVSLLGS
jgi:hypothetical protein